MPHAATSRTLRSGPPPAPSLEQFERYQRLRAKQAATRAGAPLTGEDPGIRRQVEARKAAAGAARTAAAGTTAAPPLAAQERQSLGRRTVQRLAPSPEVLSRAKNPLAGNRVGGALGLAQAGYGGYQAATGDYAGAGANIPLGLATVANPAIGLAGSALNQFVVNPLAERYAESVAPRTNIVGPATTEFLERGGYASPEEFAQSRRRVARRERTIDVTASAIPGTVDTAQAPTAGAPSLARQRPGITSSQVRADLRDPGSLPLAAGQGYLVNNTTGATQAFGGPSDAVQQAQAQAPALQAPQDQPVNIPTLNPNLSIGQALAQFMSQLGAAYKTQGQNVAAQKTYKGQLEGVKALSEAQARGRPTLDTVRASRAQQLLQEPGAQNQFDQTLFGNQERKSGYRTIQLPDEGGLPRDYLFDPQTRQVIDPLTGKTLGALPGQGGQQASPYPEGTRLTGPDGKTYVVRGGQPVLEE